METLHPVRMTPEHHPPEMDSGCQAGQGTVRLGLVQATPVHLAPFENWARIRQTVLNLAERGAELVLLPEFWATGLVGEDDLGVLKDVPRLIRLMEETSWDCGVTLVGTLPEPSTERAHPGSRPTNSTWVVGPEGSFVPYRKVHLFPPFGEDRVFEPGDDAGVSRLVLGGREVFVGFLTCYDLRFPEISRYQVFQGAQILLVSALWPKSRRTAFDRLIDVRAMENQCFVAAANAWGEVNGALFGGGSRIVGPTGETMVAAGECEDAVLSDVRFDAVDEARKAFFTAHPPRGWLPRAGRKIVDRDGLGKVIRRKRLTGQKMVFTNGCFDIFHAGHAAYLEAARGLGDFLVVGLNSDSSIRALKGEGRPVLPEGQRARVLASLESVDYVVVFDAPTPLGLIETLLPDILVKGEDWEEALIVGADVVKKHGGKVARIPFEHDVSTSAILRSITERASKS